jgi:hypothetical protein
MKPYDKPTKKPSGLVTMETKYTKTDLGCYVDGAFGVDHAYEVVAGLVEPYDKELAAELYALASGETEDEFGSETLDDATDILNQYVEDGICFYWYAGDLLLGSNEDADA